jgi:5'-deoxynucleotidase YfbR-like HD superfamily hydrolase
MTEENLYTSDCIRTFTGIYVNVFEPTPEMICIEDIAHALSMQCRFGGHLPYFYSVAQHSASCCAIAEPEHKFAALMHDASEAYLLDIPRPIKKRLANYKEIEDGLMKIIATKYGFEYPLHQKVKDVDEVMLEAEWNQIMLQQGSALDYMDSRRAKEFFMNQFKILARPVIDNNEKV